MEKLSRTSSQAVIEKMKKRFSWLGIPQKVLSDNGLQYASKDYSSFAREYEFNHVTSSPKYPQSNGLAEKTVQIAKRILDRAKVIEITQIYDFIQDRTTPLSIR